MKERVCGTTLWRLPSRQQLEDLDLLEERVSELAGEVDDSEDEISQPEELPNGS